MSEIITGATAKKEFDEWSLYNKTKFCDCGVKIDRENVVAVEYEVSVPWGDVPVLDFVCSVHCANEKIDKS